MNTIDTLLLEHFGVEYEQLTPAVHSRLRESCIYFIFRGTSSNGLTTEFTEIFGRRVRIVDFRMALRNQGYMMCNFKTFMMEVAQTMNFKQRHLIALTKRHEILDEDRKLALYLRKSTRLAELLAKYVGAINRYTLDQGKWTAFPSPKDMRREIDSVLVQLQKWCFMKSRQKLTFICNSHKIDHQDMVAELMAKAVHAYYTTWPAYETRQHIINVAVQTMGNHTINIIKHFTSKGRALLYANPDGSYRSLAVSYEMLSGGIKDKGGSFELELGMVAPGPDYLQGSITTLMEGSPKVFRRLTRYLMGEYSSRFSTWLWESRLITKNVTNDEWYEKAATPALGRRYIRWCMEFLQFTPAQRDGYMALMQRGLA